jgi:hypothetical protein
VIDYMRRALSAAAQAERSSRPDTLMLLGAAGLSYGAWLMYAPAGFIVGGVLLLVAGYLTRGAGA